VYAVSFVCTHALFQKPWLLLKLEQTSLLKLEWHSIERSDLQGVTITPTNGASIVAAISFQFWSEHHSFVFAV